MMAGFFFFDIDFFFYVNDITFNCCPSHPRFSLDLTTWNTIINACAEAKHVKTAEKYMKKMTKYGLEPDVYTYTSLLKGCALSGWLHDAMRFFFSFFHMKRNIFLTLV